MSWRGKTGGHRVELNETMLAEATRRGLTPAEIARGSGVPYSAVNVWFRRLRGLHVESAEKIGEFLGLTVSYSKARSQTMSNYLATIEAIEARGYSVTDESVEQAAEYLASLEAIEEAGYSEWSDEDVEEAQGFVASLEWLAKRGYEEFSQEDIDQANAFAAVIKYLDTFGHAEFTDAFAERAAKLAESLKWLESEGHDVSDESLCRLVEDARKAADNG